MEIERKYLVDKELWLKTNKPAGEYIIQGYLTTDIDKTIRVRVTGSVGYITIKGRTVNIAREEYEFPIPADKASELIQKFSEGILEKVRYKVPYKGKTWVVDEFLGGNKGLIIAEVELTEEHESIELPEWIGKEVSDDARYYNACLVKHPFTAW
jgi:CYTH domain-containing protein